MLFMPVSPHSASTIPAMTAKHHSSLYLGKNIPEELSSQAFGSEMCSLVPRPEACNGTSSSLDLTIEDLSFSTNHTPF